VQTCKTYLLYRSLQAKFACTPIASVQEICLIQETLDMGCVCAPGACMQQGAHRRRQTQGHGAAPGLALGSPHLPARVGACSAQCSNERLPCVAACAQCTLDQAEQGQGGTLRMRCVHAAAKPGWLVSGAAKGVPPLHQFSSRMSKCNTIKFADPCQIWFSRGPEYWGPRSCAIRITVLWSCLRRQPCTQGAVLARDHTRAQQPNEILSNVW